MLKLWNFWSFEIFASLWTKTKKNFHFVIHLLIWKWVQKCLSDQKNSPAPSRPSLTHFSIDHNLVKIWIKNLDIGWFRISLRFFLGLCFLISLVFLFVWLFLSPKVASWTIVSECATQYELSCWFCWACLMLLHLIFVVVITTHCCFCCRLFAYISFWELIGFCGFLLFICAAACCSFSAYAELDHFCCVLDLWSLLSYCCYCCSLLLLL